MFRKAKSRGVGVRVEIGNVRGRNENCEVLSFFQQNKL